jgi:ParB family transcriptional regulator, chromosome partitioning protein
MDDAALVRRLAIEKIEAKAEDLRAEWAWTKAVLDPEYGTLARYARVEPKPGKLPAELAQECQRIEERLAELDEVDADDFTDELAAEADRLEDRRTAIAEIEKGLAVYSKKDRKRAGCIVTIGDDGEFCLHQGLVDHSTTPAADTAAADTDGFSDDDEDDAFGPGDVNDDDPQARHVSSGAEQALRKELGFSQSLVDDLKAHRHQITRAHLAGNFEVAFDLALYALCSDVFDRFRYHTNPLDLRAIEATPRSSLNDLSGTPADRLIEVLRAALDLDWLKLPPVEGFAALVALPPSAKQKLFAWCIASCLKSQLAVEDRADPVLEAAGSRLAIPFADCWRPTAANYWGRVKKAHGLAVAGENLVASAGHAIMPATKSRCSPPPSKPRSIRRRARPASVSARRRATRRPRGCRRASPTTPLRPRTCRPIPARTPRSMSMMAPTARSRLHRRTCRTF